MSQRFILAYSYGAAFGDGKPLVMAGTEVFEVSGVTAESRLLHPSYSDPDTEESLEGEERLVVRTAAGDLVQVFESDVYDFEDLTDIFITAEGTRRDFDRSESGADDPETVILTRLSDATSVEVPVDRVLHDYNPKDGDPFSSIPDFVRIVEGEYVCCGSGIPSMNDDGSSDTFSETAGT